MAFTGKTLICVDCMTGYPSPAEQQQPYPDTRVTRPIHRCPDCTTSRTALEAARAAAPVVVSKRRY